MGWSPDGPASSSLVAWPSGLALGPNGTSVYWADSRMCSLRKLDIVNNTVSLVLGVPGQCGVLGDGQPALQTNLGWPSASGPQLGIAFFGNDLFFADLGGNAIRMLNSSSGNVTKVCTASRPLAVAIDASGTIFFIEAGTFSVKRCTMAGTVTAVAGGVPNAAAASGQGYIDGPAAVALFKNPTVSCAIPSCLLYHRCLLLN